MPYCSECGAKFEMARWPECQKGHQYVEPDHAAVSQSALDLSNEFSSKFISLPRFNVMLEARDAFMEAIDCCKNKDYDAFALICRAFIESALYSAKFMGKDPDVFFYNEPEVTEMLPFVYFKFD